LYFFNTTNTKERTLDLPSQELEQGQVKERAQGLASSKAHPSVEMLVSPSRNTPVK
jgi:hypothetical protein